jgi:hypothetical protein
MANRYIEFLEENGRGTWFRNARHFLTDLSRIVMEKLD